MWEVCYICQGNDSTVCWKCLGAGGYHIDQQPPPDRGKKRPYGLKIWTGLAVGVVIWFQYQNGVIAFMAAFLTAAFVSTRIGRYIAGVMWIALILMLMQGTGVF